jgi:hypothetical protein
VRARGVAAVVAIAAGISACGGGSSTPPLTHGGLDVEANTICGKANSAGQAIPQPQSFKDARAVATYLDQFEPLAAGLVANLTAIRPDPPDVAKWRELLAAERAGLAQIRKVDAGAHRGDLTGLDALFANGSATVRLRAAAYAVGADRCG